jgi:hypothetical protein
MERRRESSSLLSVRCAVAFVERFGVDDDDEEDDENEKEEGNEVEGCCEEKRSSELWTGMC